MKIRRYIGALAAVVALMSLAACGGGGGSSGGGGQAPGAGQGGGGQPTPPPPGSAAAIMSLTGAQAPQETPANLAARAPALFARVDSLVASNVYGETSVADYPTYVATSSCVGTSCTISFPFGGSESIDKDDLDASTSDSRSILTKSGITMLETQVGDYRNYYSWMDHSGFGVAIERASEGGVWVTARFGSAGGDLTGTRPGGDTTWTGLMVGTPQTGASKGNILQGDASLTFDLTNNQIDAMFTNIKNLDRGAAHSAPAVQFSDIAVAANGTYSAGTLRNRIQGGFYGTGHAETAGVFEQSGIVGAFGAKKQ